MMFLSLIKKKKGERKRKEKEKGLESLHRDDIIKLRCKNESWGKGLILVATSVAPPIVPWHTQEIGKHALHTDQSTSQQSHTFIAGGTKKQPSRRNRASALRGAGEAGRDGPKKSKIVKRENGVNKIK